jgi:hypothetical protein
MLSLAVCVRVHKKKGGKLRIFAELQEQTFKPTGHHTEV